MIAYRLHGAYASYTVRAYLSDLVREGVVKEEYAECGRMHYDVSDFCFTPSGGTGCATPVRPTTWGGIKALYRH